MVKSGESVSCSTKSGHRFFLHLAHMIGRGGPARFWRWLRGENRDGPERVLSSGFRLCHQLFDSAIQLSVMRTPEQLHDDVRRLRREQTPAENLLWQQLRAKRLNGAKFRRQHPIGNHI